MKKLLLLSLISLLTGCAHYATPQYVNGNYYLMGDDNCRRYRMAGDNSIECYTADDDYTGTRTAMTEDDIRRWQYQQQVQMAQINALSRQLNDSANQLNYQTQQMYQSMQRGMPSVDSVTPQGGTEWWYCRDITGNMTRCWR